ncbi:MAG: 2-oxoacid:acceptor oxidoreductase subunit alpha, partial [Candidatus Hydrothermarchaeales archaeon]
GDEEICSVGLNADILSMKVKKEDASIFHVPLSKIAQEVGGSKLYSNTVATGAALGLMCYDFQPLAEVLTQTFKKKGEDVVEKNIKAARAGYDYAQEHYPGRCHYVLKPAKKQEKRMLITGNEAVGLGALASGLKFLPAYPMTPSTGVMNYVAANADRFNVVVEQAEDEISALNLALGASFAGARSMTTTSGGGFSLMVEALGLAGMTETPVVIFLAQRPGPATGLPTMTEQGDLEFVLHAAQGEFPRCVIAPKSPDDAFYLTSKAFNIADKYQIPVFILSDQYLADSLFTCERFNTSKVKIERHILQDSEIKGKEYKRYLLTLNGISPRALPGQAGTLVVADSDEHDKEGHINETIEMRITMSDKRLGKLEGLKKEMTLPEIYGPKEAKVTLIGWGSTYGPLKEAVDILRTEGVDINLVHYTEIYPLPEEPSRGMLKSVKKTVCVENNATGQFARLLKVETGFSVSLHILKYDGRPFTPELIIWELKKKGVV